MLVPTRKPKEIRKLLGIPLIAAAVGAKRAENTARLYEANRLAVSEGARADLDRFYVALEAKLPAKAERQSA